VRVIASAEQDTGPATIYPRFHSAVALAQLTRWLADLRPRSAILDISGPRSGAAEAAAVCGHNVLRVIDPPLTQAKDESTVPTVVADGTDLRFVADGSADAVIAEDGTLSMRLGAEDLVAEIARVLRPGGRVLACVDSVTFGMALLAEQHRWSHLVDMPNADVVLIPWPDGVITRCYGAEQLRELFTGSGLEVSWLRPRTVFSPRTVSYLLSRDPSSFGKLVNAELRAHSDDSVGAQLVTCCVKKGLPSAAVALGLAGDTAGGRRAGLDARFRYRASAVDAAPVAAVVEPGQRGDHLRPLRHRGVHRRGIPVRFRQVRARVARLRPAAPDQVVFTQQDRERPIKVGAYFL
jgi:SAM-dependent methyltransferase